MDRKDKIKDALYKRYKAGKELSTSDLIACVKTDYPEIPLSSILPSDFCCNHTNKDPFSGKYHLFKKLGRGRYQLL
jgi:hypothetical protein